MIAGVKNRTNFFSLFAVLFVIAAAIAVLANTYYIFIIPFALALFYVGWTEKKLLFLLLLFSLPFSIEYMVTDTLGTDVPAELLMVFTGFLFVCYWAYRPGILTVSTLSQPLVLLLLLHMGWIVISSVFSTEPVLSLKFLLAKMWYIAAFVLAALVVFREKQIIVKAAGALVTGILIVTIITLVRHYQYGFSFANINASLQPFFRNHVNYSAMLVCMIPVVFIYWRSLKKGKKKYLVAGVLGLLLLALFLSYARGAWLALLVGGIAAWLIRKKLLVKAWIISIILMLGLVFFLKNNDRYLSYAHDYQKTIWHADFRDHLTATYQLRDVSTAERFYRWIAGVRMIKDNWLTGYGPNTFYYHYKPYAIPAFRTWVSRNEERSTVHNYFLLIAIEQGIPGLFFFLLLAGALLYYAQKIYHNSPDIFYKKTALVVAVILTMIFTVNFLSDLIETDKIGSLFFLCLSLLVIADRKRGFEF